MKLELCKEFGFEASHVLPKHPGRCNRLHGHSWKLKVYVKGEINPETGFVMDYAEMKRVVQPVIDRLDHHHLGTWYSITKSDHVPSYRTYFSGDTPKEWEVKFLPKDFYPSSENLIVWIGSQIDDQVGRKFWSKLELNETCTSSCVLTREEFDNAESTTRNG